MSSVTLVTMEPGALNLPAPPAGNTYIVYEVNGSAEELDGAIRVIPPVIHALGSMNIPVELADRLARIYAAVAKAMSPNSPGGSRITAGEGLGIVVVAF